MEGKRGVGGRERKCRRKSKEENERKSRRNTQRG